MRKGWFRRLAGQQMLLPCGPTATTSDAGAGCAAMADGVSAASENGGGDSVVAEDRSSNVARRWAGTAAGDSAAAAGSRQRARTVPGLLPPAAAAASPAPFCGLITSSSSQPHVQLQAQPHSFDVSVTSAAHSSRLRQLVACSGGYRSTLPPRTEHGHEIDRMDAALLAGIGPASEAAAGEQGGLIDDAVMAELLGAQPAAEPQQQAAGPVLFVDVAMQQPPAPGSAESAAGACGWRAHAASALTGTFGGGPYGNSSTACSPLLLFGARCSNSTDRDAAAAAGMSASQQGGGRSRLGLFRVAGGASHYHSDTSSSALLCLGARPAAAALVTDAHCTLGLGELDVQQVLAGVAGCCGGDDEDMMEL
eukprot:XP_001692743.1 predicted protein [Chlamydomonas reinhardtii]